MINGQTILRWAPYGRNLGSALLNLGSLKVRGEPGGCALDFDADFLFRNNSIGIAKPVKDPSTDVFDDAPKIKEGLVNSKKVEIRYFTGGKTPLSDPCEALSEHGFYGIEEQVVSAIADFIKSKRPFPCFSGYDHPAYNWPGYCFA